ncbi:MAG: aminotransferase class V-fold PLP-dependent enzyme [Planctomycetota bacterium]
MTARPQPQFAEPVRHWGLDRSVVFLNHGSFGACPCAVLERQRAFRDQLESEPVRFMMRELPELLAHARDTLANFVGADPDDLAFVANATSGVNTILRSLRFQPSDELLVTDQEYNACRNALNHVAELSGARVVVVPVPFPLASADEVVDAIVSRASARTRLVLVDHVTSQTGLVFPVARIVKEFAARGVDTLVDGAHAPGMVPLDLRALGAAYYTGNCHKWLCAPKGAALLHVRRDRQALVRPLTISHGANQPLGASSRFRVEFDWTGTYDPSAALCVPAAIETLGAMVKGGWPALMKQNRALALAARAMLCAEFDVATPAPDEMIGSLAAVPLPTPACASDATPVNGFDPLQNRLFAESRIEVPIINWPSPPRRLVRVSAQLYNSAEQYRFLASELRRMASG